MKSGIGSVLRQLIIPNGLLLAAAVLLLPWKLGAFFAPPGGRFIGLAISAAGVLLALRLRSPRLMLTLVLLLVSERAWMLTWAWSDPVLRNTLAVLLPLNVAALLLVDDSFVDWEAFAWWGGLIAVQAAGVILILGTGELSVLRRLGRPLLPHLMARSRVPQLAIVFFVLCGIGLLAAFLIQRKPRDSGMFWALAGCFLAVHAATPRLAAGYFAAAALIAGASVIETAYLVGYHDELTSLPGRRAFNQAIAALDGEYAIAMLDVDHFKRFNDTFGHDAGDQVLRLVASRMMNVGGDGKPFRYGGEEFAIIFRRIGAEEALEHAEFLRNAIADTQFVVRGLDRSRRQRTERRRAHRPRKLRKESVDTRVTVSIGVAEPSRAGMPAEEVIKAADKALYRAKENGRNRVELHVSQRVREAIERTT